MKLYIAEKPSLGRAIAQVLPRPHKSYEGFIEVGNGDKVSWCIGHLLEQAEPDAYDKKYKKWQLDHLPIVPDIWQLQVKKNTKKQFGILKKLMLKSHSFVHAGDPDREGQLLVDEVIAFVFPLKIKRPPVERLLVNDLNPEAIKKSLSQMCDNKTFTPLSSSALARARADWLYGINMTRLSTLKGQQSGYSGVLSVGRVQTPLLGLVVKRDETIIDFKPKSYFEVNAKVETKDQQQLIAKWKPSKACEPYLDEEGRVLSKKLAENVIKRIEKQPATVTDFNEKVVNKPPPSPYNLSSLQIDASRQYGLSAKQVLDICQRLYEKYKVISYPRSDCRYLPEGHRQAAPKIMQSISKNCPVLEKAVTGTDSRLKSKAWNDKKVGAHHAIIPTQKLVSNLANPEEKVYKLIARQYLMQFYGANKTIEQRLELAIVGGVFLSKGNKYVDGGWRQLLDNTDYGGKESTKRAAILPSLKKGDQLTCLEGELLEKETQPPAPFTEATLLLAMTGIARFVKSADIKKILRETDGLGTEATRAHIIELLFKRQFLKRQGKQIRATDVGKKLIKSLPELATEPDMTAKWEAELESIANKEKKYSDFFEPLVSTVRQTVLLLKSLT